MATYEATSGAVLEAIGDGTRRELLMALRRGPASVAELTELVPVSRPAVSQHLRVLRESGLVDFDRDGTRNVYRLDTAGLETLRRWVDELWDDALAAFETYARARHRPSDEPQTRKRGSR